jgi:hypothetical protein
LAHEVTPRSVAVDRSHGAPRTAHLLLDTLCQVAAFASAVNGTSVCVAEARKGIVKKLEEK